MEAAWQDANLSGWVLSLGGLDRHIVVGLANTIHPSTLTAHDWHLLVVTS